ncbi:MAG TPA: TonB-dependent receptor [Vicinamibacterales bacterium]|nr:TonB-dependent receptor [Vicinamibacterales bacterium]
MARRIVPVLVLAMLASRAADAQSVTDCNDQQDVPPAFTETITVTVHRPFRDLATVEDPRRSLIGIAGSASEGALTAKDIEGRPSARPGDLLESVPGLVISQHSGEGKANQYYLRGFNLDHGTDFAVSVAGVPVNMPTHGHGQGWSDVNFLIPELVSGVQFKKGPYYANEGDFSTAGAANINYVNALERPLAQLTVGGLGYDRLLAAASPRIGAGNLLVGFETGTADGPWVTPEDYRRLNGLVRYSRGDTQKAMALTFMGYHARWTATDQVADRAVTEGLVPRFGSLDSSDGGQTHRYTISAELQRSGTASTTKVLAYGIDSSLDLFSNFTYFLDDPVNGDQFEQVDRRRVFGVRANHRRRTRLFNRGLEQTLGLQVRHDRIGPLGLYATRDRQRLSTTRDDRVQQTSTGLYYQSELEFTDRFRVSAGLRGDVYHFDVRSNLPENSGIDTTGLVSPKLGVVFAPSNTIEVYGNVGYGFHSNDARGATITIDPVTRTQAERVTPFARTRGAEIGFRSILVPRLQTTVAVWGLALDSELVFVGDAGTTEAGRPSRRFGVEWTNYYRVRPWLTLDADLSWSSARFTDHDPIGSEIPGAVQRVASAGLSVTERRISGQLRVRYLGPRPLVEDASVEATRSMLVNAEAGYRLARGTRLVADVLNLLDVRASDIEYYYRSRLPGEPVTGVDDVHTHPVAPRTARLSLRFDF